jgi:predicted nuclease with RNAse H fold
MKDTVAGSAGDARQENTRESEEQAKSRGVCVTVKAGMASTFYRRGKRERQEEKQQSSKPLTSPLSPLRGRGIGRKRNGRVKSPLTRK